MKKARILAATAGLIGVLIAAGCSSSAARGGEDESMLYADGPSAYVEDSSGDGQPTDLPDVEPPEMFDLSTDAEMNDLAFIAERDGISLEEAVSARGWGRGFSQLTQSISNSYPKSYAGAAIEQDGAVWIAFAGAIPSDVEALVKQFEREAIEPLGSSARIELIPDRGFTERGLNARVIAAYRAVYQQSPLVSEVWAEADPRTGEIVIVVRSVSQDVAETLADVRSRVADDVTVRVTPPASG